MAQSGKSDVDRLSICADKMAAYIRVREGEGGDAVGLQRHLFDLLGKENKKKLFKPVLCPT
ncbi:MAG: hypothetical protein OEY01_00560 [Desulfobulbaceae bacterium]|nr:hypothetical protein [Desulfobulbaceae bacterium]HIJ77782.1 hypothetical protein [Deltaproteobacteria bacterium]